MNVAVAAGVAGALVGLEVCVRVGVDVAVRVAVLVEVNVRVGVEVEAGRVGVGGRGVNVGVGDALGGGLLESTTATRARWASEVETKRYSPPITTPLGRLRLARMGGPPSPLSALTPLPANVSIRSLEMFKRRTR